MKTYRDLVSYLESFIPPGRYIYPREKGLARMQELVRLLGNPQRKYRAIHIVGTAGKGSTATILAHLLTGSGLKTGLHRSPYLQSIQEWMPVDGVLPKIPDIAELIEVKLKPVMKIMSESPFGQPSYFELLVALTFLYFAQKKVDIAVIEAGLGGTFDATNVLQPIVGVLTNVGLDHTDVLGETVEEIAQDKVGFIHSGMPVVSGVKQQGVQRILENKCHEEGSKLWLLDRDFSYEIVTISRQGSVFHFTNMRTNMTIQNIELSLVGKHQIENATLALAAYFLALGRSTHREVVIRQALQTMSFPGRLEEVQANPRVLLDGAHNPDKIHSLVDALCLFPSKKTICVFGLKRKKDAETILRILLPQVDMIILTEFSKTTDTGKNAAFMTQELKRIAGKVAREKKLSVEIEVQKLVVKALERALKVSGQNDLVIVTGSLYLVGEVREMWYPMKMRSLDFARDDV